MTRDQTARTRGKGYSTYHNCHIIIVISTCTTSATAIGTWIIFDQQVIVIIVPIVGARTSTIHAICGRSRYLMMHRWMRIMWQVIVERWRCPAGV